MGKKLVFFLVLVKRCLCVLKMWLRLEYFCSVFLVLDLIVVLKGVVSVVQNCEGDCYIFNFGFVLVGCYIYESYLIVVRVLVDGCL